MKSVASVGEVLDRVARTRQVLYFLFSFTLAVSLLLVFQAPSKAYADEVEQAAAVQESAQTADAQQAASTIVVIIEDDVPSEPTTSGVEDKPAAPNEEEVTARLIVFPSETISASNLLPDEQSLEKNTTLLKGLGVEEDFAGGTGTVEDPFIIKTAVQLDNVRTQLSSNFTLANDIDLKDYLSVGNPGYNDGRGWLPIGEVYANSFKGTFDGAGNKITGLWLDRDDSADTTQYQGLFGMIGRATIKNLSVVLDTKGIAGKGMTGGLVGSMGNGGQIINCSVTGEGSVSGTGQRVGGLVGSGQTITDSYATVDVSGVDSVGGLVGYSSGLVSGSYATGNVTGTGQSVGGFVGTNNSMINTSYATGNVNGQSNVGGFIGNNMGNLSNVYATGDAYGNFYIGGLSGGGGGQISYSFATGTATGYHENPYYTGGLQGGGNNYGITESFYLGQTVEGNNNFGKYVSPEDFYQAIKDAGWDFDSIWTIWSDGSLHLAKEIEPVPEPEDEGDDTLDTTDSTNRADTINQESRNNSSQNTATTIQEATVAASAPQSSMAQPEAATYPAAPQPPVSSVAPPVTPTSDATTVPPEENRNRTFFEVITETVVGNPLIMALIVIALIAIAIAGGFWRYRRTKAAG